MGACDHLLSVGVSGPETDPAADCQEPSRDNAVVCPECREDGYEVWAHLRKCLECGHVGCCDSSPYRHASKHHDDTGHPVMRSFEPGESWRWCYVDRRLAP